MTSQVCVFIEADTKSIFVPKSYINSLHQCSNYYFTKLSNNNNKIHKNLHLYFHSFAKETVIFQVALKIKNITFVPCVRDAVISQVCFANKNKSKVTLVP